MQIYETTLNDPITPPETFNTYLEDEPDISFPTATNNNQKLYIDGVDVTILAERVEYLNEHGKLITQSIRDFSKKTLQKRFVSLDEFLKRWRSTVRKQLIIDELANEGILLNVLAEEIGKDFDPFDLICHVAFDQPPLTRKQRAQNVRQGDIFTKYGQQAQQVLEAIH